VSAHVGAWHTPLVHTPLWQSVLARHFLPSRHAVQAAPPQSTSVSVPFFARSPHPAAWQDPLVHTALTQSVAAWHT
jgi:hypothetical protein